MRRILSIDGGGIRGVFPASFLANIEQCLSRPLRDYFDLIVGTSTGGIITLGLGLGFSAAEILDFYKRYGPEIFRGHSSWGRWAGWMIRGKYSNKPLERALKETFGDRRLGESTKRLVVPSLNLVDGEPHIYKTAHDQRFERDYKVSAVDVALATSAAPSFFPSHRSLEGIDLIDGGIYATNPTGMAVAEAIGVLGWPREELHVLSVGCTTVPFSGFPKGSVGVVRIALRALDLFMRGQSHASMGTAYVLLDHKRVVRVDPLVPEGKKAMDNAGDIAFFEQLGDKHARHMHPQLKDVFFTQPAEAFEPFHKL